MADTDRIRQVLARYRGTGALLIADYIRSRFGQNTPPAALEDHIAFCYEVIDSLPKVIDAVRAEAERQGVLRYVDPVLAHAEQYLLDANDVLPQSELGELGLLDDAYLAYRVIALLELDGRPLLRVDLSPPIDLLTQVLGPEVTARLDEQVQAARATASLQNTMRRLQRLADRSATRSAQQPTPLRTASAPQRPVPRPDPQRRVCHLCSGAGQVTCTACNGMGYHTQSYSRIDWQGNTDYVTDHIPCGCSGGYAVCSGCGGSGWR